MKKIEVDSEVMAVLEKSVMGFGATPNSTLRRILGIDANGAPPPDARSGPRGPQNGIESQPLVVMLASPRFVTANGQQKYLLTLSAVYKDQGERFSDVMEFKYGERKHFARTMDEINRSGHNASACEIPDSPYAALTNLSARRKKKITGDVLRYFKYPESTIDRVLNSFPEAKRRKRAA